jgi:hypothetical protein
VSPLVLTSFGIAKTALLWLLFDIVVYSGILFGPSLIAKGLGLAPTTFSLLQSFGFVIPGALTGVALIDKIGRKQLPVIGFIGAAIMLGLFAWQRDQVMSAPTFGMLLSGLYSVFITGGPSMASGAGILGVELARPDPHPHDRPIGHRGRRRIGASISAFSFPCSLVLWARQASSRCLPLFQCSARSASWW